MNVKSLHQRLPLVATALLVKVASCSVVRTEPMDVDFQTAKLGSTRLGARNVPRIRASSSSDNASDRLLNSKRQ